MPIQSIAMRERALSVTWTDQTTTLYPYAFLRDNDPAGLHPQTGERVFDLLSIPETLRPVHARLEGDALVLEWGPGGEVTAIDTRWLSQYRPGTRTSDPADMLPALWGAELERALPRFAAEEVLAHRGRLRDWLLETKRVGLSLVSGLDDREDAGVEIGQAIGFLRETNFGRTFRVETKPDPNNLAYTARALALHTDLPNQELPPGFQFLHCIRNEARGGGSIFADAFRIAERLREKDERAFALLSSIPIPYRFHDRDCDIRIHRPLIGLDERGRVFDVRYSAHLLDAFDMPAEIMTEYYRAFRLFMAQTREAENLLSLRLGAGEMVVFDNRRVLHGRESFDPATGHRLLIGFYVDRGELDSRIRVLSRGEEGFADS